MGQAATRGAARRRTRLTGGARLTGRTRLTGGARLPIRSVHQRLRPVGDDFGDERGRPGDAYPGDDVVLGDLPAGRALGAQRDRADREDAGEQLAERYRVGQPHVVSTVRQREPGGLAGQPQRYLKPGGDRGRRDGERLVAAFRVILARGDLDDQRARGHASTLARAAPARRGVGNGARVMLTLRVCRARSAGFSWWRPSPRSWRRASSWPSGSSARALRAKARSAPRSRARPSYPVLHGD